MLKCWIGTWSQVTGYKFQVIFPAPCSLFLYYFVVITSVVINAFSSGEASIFTATC